MFFHGKLFDAERRKAVAGDVATLLSPLSVVIIAPSGTPEEEMRRAAFGAIDAARRKEG